MLVVPALVPTAAAPAPLLTIDGAVARTLTTADLAALPRTSVRWTVHGTTLACSGPRLADVLATAGLPTGAAVRGTALATVIVAGAADGYRVAFTLGELDPLLGNAGIIVADGPLRLVVAADTRGARSVRRLVRLTVTTAAGG